MGRLFWLSNSCVWDEFDPADFVVTLPDCGYFSADEDRTSHYQYYQYSVSGNERARKAFSRCPKREPADSIAAHKQEVARDRRISMRGKLRKLLRDLNVELVYMKNTASTLKAKVKIPGFKVHHTVSVKSNVREFAADLQDLRRQLIELIEGQKNG